MGVSIITENPDLSNEAKTRLSGTLASGSTSVTVDNTAGFAANDFLIISGDTNDTNELRKVSSITSATVLVVTASTSFAHSDDAIVSRTTFDKVSIQSSTTVDGTYTEVAQISLNFANDTYITAYFHSVGTSSTYYKFKYVNSNNLTESGLSSVIQPNSYYCGVEDVYSLLGFKPDDQSAPDPQDVLKIIESRCRRFDGETNSSYVTNTVESTDPIYVDGRGLMRRRIYLSKAPIITLTLQTTTQMPGNTATWNTLTSGRDNDYVLYKEIGVVEIIDTNFLPLEYVQSIRWYGSWGRSEVPADVSQAIAMGVAIDLADSAVYRAFLQGRDGFNPSQIERFQVAWNVAVKKYLNMQLLLTG